MIEEGRVKEYMKFIIQEICEKIGPRPPCSLAEAECADYLEKELSRYADSAQIENFLCHPGSYHAQFRIPPITILITTLFYWIHFFVPHPTFLLIPLCLTVFCVIVIQTNVMRNLEFIDPLFPQKESTNVFAKFKPKTKVKHRLVIGGHHDSNWEFPILRKSMALFGFIIVLSNVLPFALLGVSVIKLIFLSLANPYLFVFQVDLTLLLFLTALAPLFTCAIFKLVSHTPVMGADDNLSALAVILALGRHLKDHPLQHTEIWLVSHGCEEIGDRGSKRFVQRHYDELKDSLVINLDMVGGQNSSLRFVTAEVVFLVKLSEVLANILAQLSKELDISHQVGKIEAFTDSMAYAQTGIEVCSIVGFPESGFPIHYHTRHDTLDKLDVHNLWNCYTLLLHFITKLDAGAILPPSSSVSIF